MNRLEGLRRWARWANAVAWCSEADRWVCAWDTSGKYDAVSRLARKHTRETGHRTEVRGERRITYQENK